MRRLLDTYPLIIVHYTDQRTYSFAQLEEQQEQWDRTVSVLRPETVLELDALANVCNVVKRIEQLDRRSLPAYVITDSTLLAQKLREAKCFEQVYEAQTLSQFKTALMSLDTQPRGVLVNAMQEVNDVEYNLVLGPNQIGKYLAKHKRHIDVSIVVLEHNLSLVVVRDKKFRLLITHNY